MQKNTQKGLGRWLTAAIEFLPRVFSSTGINHLTKFFFLFHNRIEVRYLKERCNAALTKFYDSKGHQKRQMQGETSRFQDLRRDLQAVIGARTNLNVAQIENFGGEIFVNEEVVISILQDSKSCFQRCKTVRIKYLKIIS